ncbi:MAG: rod shape-determining protein RodA [bacterium]|nr:rod shape-determining protein RodA [bacterium]
MINFRAFKYIHYSLLIVTVLLVLIGVVSIYSAAYQITLETNAQVHYAMKQLAWACIGIFIFFVIIFYGYDGIYKLSYPLFLGNILLLVLVLVLGSVRHGSQRWLQFGGVLIQPSEFAKLTFVLALARYVSKNLMQNRSFMFVLKPLLLTFIPVILILQQPDLGTSLVFFPVFLSVIFVAGVNIRYLIKMSLVGITTMPFLWFCLRDYQKNRIRVFCDPNLDPTGLGYQAIQSKIAVGAGGLFGKGWLNGTQNQLNFLPKRHTDFIFSVISEEWGFLGVVLVLSLYFLLVVMGIYIASKSKDTYGKLLAVGISFMILSHVVINVGMTVGIMPITGLPLVFLSYGGSSMLTALISIAILESIWIKRRYDY